MWAVTIHDIMYCKALDLKLENQRTGTIGKEKLAKQYLSTKKANEGIEMIWRRTIGQRAGDRKQQSWNKKLERGKKEKL